MRLLSLSGICKTYRTREVSTAVLHGIDLEIRHGEFIAIMGQSGSGKSTLLNILGLLDFADEGTYSFEDKDIMCLDRAQQAHARSRSIGFVFQSFNLLRRATVLENVALPSVYSGATRSDAKRRASQLLDRLGLSAMSDRLPSQLSGGQQQRVAIARALINEPPLLLADEPTGNLDTGTADEVMQLFEALNREAGITVILVTHDLQIGERAGRLIRLADGRIIYDDNPRSGDSCRTQMQSAQRRSVSIASQLCPPFAR